MMNITEMASLLRGRNPQEMALSMIKNNNINDPLINQLIQYAQTGDMQTLTKTAENLFAQQGMNFGQEFSALMSMLK